jgi:IclR family acetate operon transcriptional repressor
VTASEPVGDRAEVDAHRHALLPRCRVGDTQDALPRVDRLPRLESVQDAYEDVRALRVREDSRLRGHPSKAVELGWELFRLASIVQARHPFQGAAEILDELSTRTGETALLAVYDARRRERMFTAASQSRQSVRFVPELYSWLPMHAGASALAILAYRPDEERQALYAQGSPPVTSTTTPEAVEAALDEVRRNGYAVTHDGVYLGASGVAAPIATRSGVTSSVAVIVPK